MLAGLTHIAAMRKFQFVISMPRSSIAVRIVEAQTDAQARYLAERVLGESRNHLGVDVWEHDRHLFNVGAGASLVA